MRTQGEVIADEYSEFSKKWYEHALSVESDFDNIFKEVVANIGFEFNWEEYHKRILE
jgi:DNA-directed RNA polymerase subunit N (RpoN/RPB10)